MADTRIYLITERGTKGEARLVEATSAAQAVRHCAKNIYTAQAATPKEVATLMGSGITIETATEHATTTHTATT